MENVIFRIYVNEDIQHLQNNFFFVEHLAAASES